MTENHATKTATLGSGLEIPLIGLGTWPLQGEEAADMVDRALRNGYRHLDTAKNYLNHDGVGEGIRRSGVDRSEIWVTSKFNKESHSYDGAIAAYDSTLREMGLEYLDLFLIHWPNPSVGGFVEASRGLQSLVDAGRLRAWGVSNFKQNHLEQVFAAGLTPAVNQIQVDPLVQQRELIAFTDSHGIPTVAYSPLGRAGDFFADPAIAGPAEKYGKSAAQVVLRWHLEAGRVAIPRSANEEHQRQNLEIFDFSLTPEETAAIGALDTGKGARHDSDEFGH
ncbi:aldo/keto reductase [Neomicrococcus aestuarii]|uniref:Oxidoreductase n=1 Tax=Neomicrococcus aestuarii TaxID=556325 RepID=A0A1L2ZQH9_9MICC|nr:aldo/keto reductase [Neomicrococcus aestuarii]APF41406.1 oxidoreductase [Neomicrococcus aestuarii]